MRSSINNQVRRLWLRCDGINTSKYVNRKNSQYLGQNGFKISPKIHSFVSKDEFILRAKELGNFVVSQFAIKDMQAITNEHLMAYIWWKIESDVLYSSMSTYISQLEKIQITIDTFNKIKESHLHLFNRAGLIEARKIAKMNCFNPEHKDRAYDNLHGIKSHLQSNESRIVFQLQQEHGLRVSEASLVQSKQLLNMNMKIQGKGGYKLTIIISKDLYTKIKNYMKNNKSFHISYSKYTNELKKAVEISGQKWNGTHGIRYSFAQKKYLKFINDGLSDTEALLKVSKLMGHNRAEISLTYVG